MSTWFCRTKQESTKLKQLEFSLGKLIYVNEKDKACTNDGAAEKVYFGIFVGKMLSRQIMVGTIIDDKFVSDKKMEARSFLYYHVSLLTYSGP